MTLSSHRLLTFLLLALAQGARRKQDIAHVLEEKHADMKRRDTKKADVVADPKESATVDLSAATPRVDSLVDIHLETAAEKSNDSSALEHAANVTGNASVEASSEATEPQPLLPSTAMQKLKFGMAAAAVLTLGCLAAMCSGSRKAESPLAITGPNDRFVQRGAAPSAAAGADAAAPLLKSSAAARGSALTATSTMTSNSVSEREQTLLAELEELSVDLAKAVQKSSKSMLGMMKQQPRFVAVKPASQDSSRRTTKKDGSTSVSAAKAIARWRRGTLGWWEDAAAAGEPRGQVDLMQITKVQIHKEDKTCRTVAVRYSSTAKDADRDSEDQQAGPCELLLYFAAKQDAEAWSGCLHDFLSKLRTRPADGAVLGSAQAAGPVGYTKSRSVRSDM